MRRSSLLPPARVVPFLPLVVLTAGLPGPKARSLSAQEADLRVARVENGLARAIQVRGRSPERFSIQERMSFYRVPGVSVAVLDEGHIAWAKGYGVKDVETGEPVTAQTLFQAASISKPVA